ncbi:MAG: STAS domain-containing protein, partial [Desulfobacterales bacterium]|nr:STAS domain-containing protein [Desulfobacterales bacterium]
PTRAKFRCQTVVLIYSSKGFEMEIDQKEENGIVFIAFKGRLDGTSAPEAEETINTIFKGESNRLLFDFEFLEYLSSAGLRVILGAAKEMKRRDGKFVLCALNSYVKEVFEVSGFGAIIPIADSVESGIKEIS